MRLWRLVQGSTFTQGGSSFICTASTQRWPRNATRIFPIDLWKTNSYLCYEQEDIWNQISTKISTSVAANKLSSYPAIDALCLGAFGLSLPAVPPPDEFLICQHSILGGFPFVEVMTSIEEFGWPGGGRSHRQVVVEITSRQHILDETVLYWPSGVPGSNGKFFISLGF